MADTPKVQHRSGSTLTMKIAHRLTLLPPPRADGKRIRVLDAFAGDHDIWNGVRRFRDDLSVVHIEKDPKRASRTDLVGDNMKYLAGMDLNRFDAIDLDAWGIPGDQMDVVARQRFRGVVFLTCILVRNVKFPQKVMEAIGITPEQYRIAPTLVSRMHAYDDVLHAWLAALGYERAVFAVEHPHPLHHYAYGAVGYESWDPAAYRRNFDLVARPG